MDVATSHSTQFVDAFRPNLYGYAALGISLLSNVFATVLIGIKAWYVTRLLGISTCSDDRVIFSCEREHRKIIQQSFGHSATTTVSSTLILFTESGLLYCVLWVRQVPISSCRHSLTCGTPAHELVTGPVYCWAAFWYRTQRSQLERRCSYDVGNRATTYCTFCIQCTSSSFT